MILGYEEPVLMPTMDIYSTDLMKMYIAAVKDQYDTAKKDYQDFLKQYQDFYSNMPGANEFWYANTIGKAQQLFDQAAARGVDLFKTKEGQGAIQSLIRNAPIADLAKVKKYSENYDMYLKNKAAMDLAGKYSDAREQYELARLGLSDYTLLDEHGNIRPWERLSPIQNRSMSDIIDPIYKKFAPLETLRNGDRPFTIIKGVKPQNQQAALSASVLAMKSSGDYDFYKLLAMDRIQVAAEQLGLQLSPQQLDLAADVQLQQDIQNAAAEYLQEKEEYDQNSFNYWAKQLDIRQHELNRANAIRILQLKNGEKESTEEPIGFIDTLRLITKNKIQNKTGADPDNLLSALFEFKNRYKNLGYKDTDPQIKRIDDILNTEDTNSAVNKAKQLLLNKGYISVSANGEVKRTEKYYKDFNKAVKRNHNLKYNDMISQPVTDMQRLVLLGMFAGQSKDGSYKNQYTINNFLGSKYSTLTNRLAQIDRTAKNKIAQAFENFVNQHSRLRSHLAGGDDIISYGTISSGLVDINSYNRFKISDIQDFLTATGYTKEQLATATGGHFIDGLGKEVYQEKDKPNKLESVEVEYIVIPSSNIIDVHGQNQALIDGAYDKLFGGASKAFSIESSRQQQANN